VIIPVFNVEKYLRRCLDSVLSQTFTDFEIILVDDCSPDASPRICEEYAQKDNRIKVIHNPQNKGSSLTRKVGLDEARGDYILFVDSDDWIESNMLELLYNKAIDDDLDMVYCGIYRNTDTEQSILDFPFLDDKIEMIKEIVTGKEFSTVVWNKLVKHEILNKIIFPAANHGEDVQISVQTIHYARKIGYVKKNLCHYYHNANSITNDSSRLLQSYADHYKISVWVINFLSDNYRACFNIFEPDLSARINSIKLPFVLEKSIRNTSKLHELYPASNKNIFNVTWGEPLDNKILLYLTAKHFGLLAYPAAAFIRLVMKIYRLLVPKNIRSTIWKKRMMQK
jgi:glycosyltransferase involved in cell wall biosynthesis